MRILGTVVLPSIALMPAVDLEIVGGGSSDRWWRRSFLRILAAMYGLALDRAGVCNIPTSEGLRLAILFDA
jgi:hypothetical protein